jgi:hypothetical protein
LQATDYVTQLVPKSFTLDRTAVPDRTPVPDAHQIKLSSQGLGFSIQAVETNFGRITRKMMHAWFSMQIDGRSTELRNTELYCYCSDQNIASMSDEHSNKNAHSRLRIALTFCSKRLFIARNFCRSGILLRIFSPVRENAVMIPSSMNALAMLISF